MVQPFAVLGEEARHTRVRARRLEQLDLAVTGGQEHGAHALIGDFRLADEREAQGVPPEAAGARQALDHDADVMDLLDHA